MNTHLSKCLPLKITGKLRVSIKDKDNVIIAKNLYLPDALYIVEMVNKCAALEARLQEAEAIIKPLGDAYVVSCGNTPPTDDEEAEQVLYDVFNSITIEVPARAAAWLKGGTE